MKRNLHKLNKKDLMVKMGGKNLVSLAGVYYCAKCGYRMNPEIDIKGRGADRSAEFFIDLACLCDQL